MKKILSGVSVVIVIALVAVVLINASTPVEDTNNGNIAPAGQTMGTSTTVPSDFTVTH